MKVNGAPAATGRGGKRDAEVRRRDRREGGVAAPSAASEQTEPAEPQRDNCFTSHDRPPQHSSLLPRSPASMSSVCIR